MKNIYLYDEEICGDGEIWKPVAGYEGLYEVSNRGRVRRLCWKIVKPRNQNGEYQRIGLSKNGEEKQYLVHRLVAEAFIPNPGGYPIINHKDEIPKNNRVENLEWCDPKHNANWGSRNAKLSAKAKNKRAVVAVDKKTGEEQFFPSITNAVKSLLGKCSGGSSITEAAQGIRKSAYGKYWRYAESEDDDGQEDIRA